MPRRIPGWVRKAHEQHATGAYVFLVIVVAGAFFLAIDNRNAAFDKIKTERQAAIARERAARIGSDKKIRAQRNRTVRIFAKADLIQCQRTNRLITRLIKPGLKNLDKQAYYAEHPEEKRLVRQQIKKALRIANPSTCHSLPSQHGRLHSG